MTKQNDTDHDFTNDPRLTAYALGELDGAERAEIEALLARDDAARKVVDEIRATANLVAAELGAAGGVALTETQRAAIAAKATAGKPVRRMRPVYWAATAASVAAAVAGVAYMKGNARHAAAIDGFAQASADNDQVTAVMGRVNETMSRLADTDKTKAVAEAQLRQLQDSNTQLASANQAARKRLDEIAKAQRGPPGGSGGLLPSGTAAYSEGGGGGGGGGVFSGIGDGKVRTVTGTRPATITSLSIRLEDGAVGQGGQGQAAAGGGPAADGDVEKLKRLASLGYIDSGEREGSTESYAHIDDNPFRLVTDAPLSTFGIDVDTASYSNVRRLLNAGQLPPPGAVRIEEMLNYFPYEYAPPSDGRPFAVRVDVAGCPWKTDHRLVRVGIKGKVVAAAARPAANLVFLVDVSGSMNEPDKLPLLVQSMKLMVEQLEPRDRVAIVVYAGSSGLVLPSTSCTEKAAITAALDRLSAGGSTNGGAGIQLAYDTAVANRIDGGVNRVVLATDGDFNVGVTDESSLVKLIEEKAKSGVFLSVLGFGTGNYKDSQMEKLADRGNGNYAYVDTLKEGRKALVDQMSGTLLTIAKDVKIQVEFNPSQVGSYRLIGYENRVLAAEDFKDDKKDAGEIGAGHTVTAIYEVVPPGASATESVGVEPLKYQKPPAPTGSQSRELLTVKLRWKEPNADVSTPMEVPVVDEGLSYSAASGDFKFAASVAAFGMVLRGSPHKGNVTLGAILELATEGAANDPGGYRAEFVGLVKRAAELGAK